MATTTTQFNFSLCSYTAFVVLGVFLLIIQISKPADSKTLESDIAVLHDMRDAIDPASISSSSFLNTWDFATDPCETTGVHFFGVTCDIHEDGSNSSSRVTGIDLEGDGLEGFLPSQLGNLSELTTFNVKHNKFRGTIPPSIVNLKKIKSLLLSDNFFYGSIPDDFYNLKTLETVDFSRNKLSGSIPPAISKLRSLTELSLANNEFTGRLPNLIAIWQLKTLDLSSNQFYGDIPTLPKDLTTLTLSHNLLYGHITPVNKLRRLKTLDISDNKLSGEISQEIFTLPEVTLLNISYNMFTTISVIKISASTPNQLQVIEAQGNRIHGHLPVNLVTYENLSDVNLGHNLFRGEIPRQYGEQLGRSWRSLFLDYNLLEGKVPNAFKNNEVKGSIAHNCLKNCSTDANMCGGGQRPHSECVRN